MPVPVLYQDPFSPVLRSSPPLLVTEEQKMYVREVLSIAASDEQFADKAYRAITKILTGGSVVAPAVTGLTPASAVIGSPNFDLLVNGSGFTAESVIYFNGGAEPTTYVSATQVKTGVNMSTVTVPSTVPVAVLSKDGVLSNAMNFAFTGAAVLSAPPPPVFTPAKPTTKEEKKDK